uniref:Uncharacterized protein n=1 Tax=Mycena chlorophos TaxID=658473 RepID=A0ABQ0L987_MYCCL|nr:predicted protein [Mycena chlorophos]
MERRAPHPLASSLTSFLPPPMCLYLREVQPRTACQCTNITNSLEKISDCNQPSCEWSLYHPLSLYRHGRSIVESTEGKLLLRATFSRTPISEDRIRLSMRVNVQRLEDVAPAGPHPPSGSDSDTIPASTAGCCTQE